jgi:hypothetical protein
MSVWPSISAGPWGRWLGRWFDNRTGISIGGIPITLGWILVVKTIPLTAFLYAHKIVPRIPFVVFGWQNSNCRRYRLTNRRVIIDHPFTRHEFSSLPIEGFETVELEQRPGHAWFRAADIVFRRGPSEVFRLPGVPHAEAFRQTILKTKRSRATTAPQQAAPASV